MIRRPPITTRTDTLFPYTTLFRSTTAFLLRDASGLSSANLVTPEAVVGLLRAMRDRPGAAAFREALPVAGESRSEEHTSELQSLMRSSYAVFCLKKKKRKRSPTKALVSERETCETCRN